MANLIGVEKLQKLIAGCTFSVFPSHAYETLGKSILESYAWGRPVIASDLGSRRELVVHGVTGLLYADGDREQLAHSITFLVDRPDLVAKMGAAARERVKSHYAPDEHLGKLLTIYDRLRSNPAPSPDTVRSSRAAAERASKRPLPQRNIVLRSSVGAAWSPNTAASNRTTSKLDMNSPNGVTRSRFIAGVISLRG